MGIEFIPDEPDAPNDPVLEVLLAIEAAERAVMALYGGNLDHPALDSLFQARIEVQEVDAEATF